MPIHFRCAHCEKLLGIARRKAGTIVNCPQCGQPLIVPTPEDDEPEQAADPEASTHETDLRTSKENPGRRPKRSPGEAGQLFEQDEIDRLLELSLNKQQQQHSGGSTIPSRSMVPQPYPTSNGLPAPLPAPIPAPLPVIVPTAGGLSIGKILALLLIVFALVTGAFVAGLFVGKGSSGSVQAQ